jgi:hypothetical protein
MRNDNIIFRLELLCHIDAMSALAAAIVSVILRNGCDGSRVPVPLVAYQPLFVMHIIVLFS